MRTQKVRTTTVFRRIPEYNYLHGQTRFFLKETDLKISDTISNRLQKYAEKILDDAGFITDGFSKIHIYTNDHDRKVNDRTYVVEFLNDKGNGLCICGIFLQKGTPFLHHGIETVIS